MWSLVRPKSLRQGRQAAARLIGAFSTTPASWERDRKWSTPLAKQLAEAITTTGPIPLASYMRMCLTSDTGGYYTGALSAGRDQFGRKGDFITSPEISQIFGELVGLWFVAEWMSQGKPHKGVELIEVGPGRGTLMDDMLRTIQNFPDLAHSIDAIYMVEASPTLRVAQKDLLCGKDAPMTESRFGYHSICKYTSLPIVWTETLRSIPIHASKMPFIVAHEFFDALPIHVFQVVDIPSSKDIPASEMPDRQSPSSRTVKPTLQWREMLVSPTPADATHASLSTPRSQQDEPPPEFQLAISAGRTRHALYLPETSARYRNLKNVPDALIEVCPDASIFVGDIAARIGGSAKHPKSRPSGAALILDYGPAETVPVNSLRGIRRHKRVSPFSEPGLVDLSADVDFGALAEAALKMSDGVEVHGPVEQAHFLLQMGIEERANYLIKQLGESAGKASEVERAWKRLIDRGPDGMGRIYKALAILPENAGRRRPVGFGGDI